MECLLKVFNVELGRNLRKAHSIQNDCLEQQETSLERCQS